MKEKAKSSITLPAAELGLVKKLKRRIGVKSNVEVIRRSLYLLRDKTDRDALRQAYRQSVHELKDSIVSDIGDLDHLSDEGLPKK